MTPCATACFGQVKQQCLNDWRAFGSSSFISVEFSTAFEEWLKRCNSSSLFPSNTSYSCWRLRQPAETGWQHKPKAICTHKQVERHHNTPVQTLSCTHPYASALDIHKRKWKGPVPGFGMPDSVIVLSQCDYLRVVPPEAPSYYTLITPKLISQTASHLKRHL